MLLPHLRCNAERKTAAEADVAQVEQEKDRVHVRFVIPLLIVRENDDVLGLQGEPREGVVPQKIAVGEIDGEGILPLRDRRRHRLPVGLARRIDGHLRNILRKLVQNGVKRFQPPDDGDLFRSLLRTALRIDGKFPRFRRFDELRGVVLLREDEDPLPFPDHGIARRVDPDPIPRADSDGDGAVDAQRQFTEGHAPGLKRHRIELAPLEIEDLPERLGKPALRAGMRDDLGDDLAGLQGRDVVLFGDGRRETVLRLRDDRADADARGILTDDRGHGEKGFRRPVIVRRADDDRAAGGKGAPLERFRVEDIHRPANDPDVFRFFDVVGNVLLHFFLLDIVRDDDAVGLFGRRQNELLEQGVFARIEAEHDDVILFDDGGRAPFEAGDLFLDPARDDADEDARDKEPRDRGEGHQDQIDDPAVFKGGHPRVDDGRRAVPEGGEKTVLTV